MLFQRIKYLMKTNKLLAANGRAIRHSRGVGVMALVLCQCHWTHVDEKKPADLSHKHCIKQSCVLTVNSTTVLLTTVCQAILDAGQHYQNMLSQMVSFLHESLETQGGNSVLQDAIVAAREELEVSKKEFNEFNDYFGSVEKVVFATTEVAFLSGADYMCTALSERMHSAQQEIIKTVAAIKALEEECLKLQAIVIQIEGKQ